LTLHVRALLVTLGIVAAMGVAPSARADDAPESVMAPKPGIRIGVLPLVGFGVAGLTNSGDLPGFIGFTSLGLELHGERPPFGLLLRGHYLSSGQDGRWTAPSLSAGVSYRFFGDGIEHLSLLGRGGLLYDRWHATNVGTGCPVDLFFPTNCKALALAAPSGVILAKTNTESVTVDAFGVFAGVRLELPVAAFYAAVDAELTMVGDVSASSPGAIFGLRSGIAIGFRDRRDVGDAVSPRNDPRLQRRY
jgi:hypothetical protein